MNVSIKLLKFNTVSLIITKFHLNLNFTLKISYDPHFLLFNPWTTKAQLAFR